MLFGIDCGSVDDNGAPDWTLAKAKGPLSFAIVRANESTWRDPKFASYWAALGALQVPRGAYLFLRFPDDKKAVPPPAEQAKVTIDMVGDLAPSDLPPVLDVEFPDGRPATGMSAAQAIDWIGHAWRALRDHYGVPPIVYTSARVWHEDLDNIVASDLLDSPLWLARYFIGRHAAAQRDAGAFDGGRWSPPVPVPWGDDDNWWIHQYQGDAVAFPGFAGTVDVDRFHNMVRGASGARVTWVQRRLGVAATGTFDGAMLDQVIAFQSKAGLVADGVIGPRTFARLCWQPVRT